MRYRRTLMLVSALADARLRDEVQLRRRPCPEYLRLEERHGLELLDWSQLKVGSSRRSTSLSLAHARAGLRQLGHFDAVFTDGEHVGIPLALGMLGFGLSTPHLMLGHHLTTRIKRPIFRSLRPQSRISRILLHSRRQLDLASRELRIPSEKLRLVPYYADTRFWFPGRQSDEALVVAAGREHRDYGTLARACEPLSTRVFIAAGSVHSPSAHQQRPLALPANIRTGFADYAVLRDWYSRAAVIAVPLVANDFQAGVTTILEGMAMARPVVVSATEGQRDIIEDGVTGVMVPPGNAVALREAVAELLANPAERRRLGANARDAVLRRFSLEAYASGLAQQVEEIADA